ncbi:MAG: GNAT family N-acetyltransferase, partial [Chloroflexota bacterium]
SRFEITMPDGSLSMVEYHIAGKNIIYTHTEVPPKYEGNGVAGKLAHHVMEYAQENDFKVQALCPYIAMYVARHEEYQPITWGY